MKPPMSPPGGGQSAAVREESRLVGLVIMGPIVLLRFALRKPTAFPPPIRINPSQSTFRPPRSVRLPLGVPTDSFPQSYGPEQRCDQAMQQLRHVVPPSA